ncbi:hypothetical protein [Blastopirellula retiformator]|uniref:Uncharacterized protein n=1 Tax=Blastopirellula retiformator TaxID=2527970 RepID=A0A5C5VKY7_9BACT|nr:hypothetical protein [Blastopirellula retiformator]TWT38559.1 hypothetical protein Enr8_02520 [Blastopirellula retiformator]
MTRHLIEIREMRPASTQIARLVKSLKIIHGKKQSRWPQLWNWFRASATPAPKPPRRFGEIDLVFASQALQTQAAQMSRSE